MATYDVVTDPHPLLNDDVLALDETKQEALNDAAELVLGLATSAYTSDTDISAATLAVVYQMNYMAVLPDEAWGITRERRGQRDVQYRQGRGQSLPRIAPLAREALSQISDRGWADGRASVRGGNW